MISQKFPAAVGRGSAGEFRRATVSAPGWLAAEKHEAEQGIARGNGSVRLALYLAPRREGTRLDPGLLPGGVGARPLRRTLLLSGAGSAGGGRRGQHIALRDRDAARALSALFGRARRVHALALRHERDAEGRKRGTGDSLRHAQEPCRHHGGGRLRRPWTQIPDLGARTLARGTRGGHRAGARTEEA